MPKSLQPVIFELKFNAKKIRKRAKKADVQREEAEENVKKELQKGRPEVARIHASKCIRKQKEYLNLVILENHLDETLDKVEAAESAKEVAAEVNKINGIVSKINQGNLAPEKLHSIIETFQNQTTDTSIKAQSLESMMDESSAAMTNPDTEDTLLKKYTEEIGVERAQDMPSASKGIKQNDKVEQALDETLRRARA